ncbi:sequestosome-1-like [Elysia marginata]|uniref:Sequestosome-1-like n=1 Tax=Elysia marginata TaxID=1093978 RepID=A0AAV4IQ77_9GAST|nr:sequestosome-1-like [Elysia marginata]
MEKTVKVFLSKLDSTVEVRRFPMSVSASHSQYQMSGQFGVLLARIASTFPSLRDKAFDLTWKDVEGDLILMSSDEELSEALAASNNPILRVYINEAATQSVMSDPRVLPTAPPQPCYDYGSGQHGAPYPPAPALTPGGYPPVYPPQPGMVMGSNQPRINALSPMPSGSFPVQDDSNRPAHCDKKAWKTALRAQVPAPQRRWAKSYIRQWRRAHVGNATTSTSSDCERAQKLTREEAGVPQTYEQWLDKILPKMHKCFAKEGRDCSGDGMKGFKDIKTTVPAEFQNWCQWYLKRHFGSKHRPELKAEEKDKRCAGNKDWKSIKREMKKSVPREYRVWSRIFIKQWEEDHLYSKGNISTSSSSSGTETDSDPETGVREATLAEIIIPADYPRWLRKFLNWKFSSMGVTFRVPDQNVVDGSWEQFKDSVPKEYRKWARSYINHRLNRTKKTCKKNQGAAQSRACYNKWLLAFQKRWVEEVGGNPGRAPMKEVTVDPEAASSRLRNQAFDMDRLREVIDSSDSEEENEGTLQKQKIPPEFREWARNALDQWDGMTLPPSDTQRLPYSETSQQPAQDDIPPRVMNWMIKIMTKNQMKKMKAQMRAERKEIKMQRREEKAEKRAAKAGFKAARRSLKVARQAIKFRYV